MMVFLLLTACSGPTEEFQRDVEVLESSPSLLDTIPDLDTKPFDVTLIPTDADAAVNQPAMLAAFTWCTENECYLVIVDRQTDEATRLLGPFLDWRPFSDLQWVNDEILAFDQWSNPTYGSHYEIDALRQEIVILTRFTSSP